MRKNGKTESQFALAERRMKRHGFAMAALTGAMSRQDIEHELDSTEDMQAFAADIWAMADAMLATENADA
jgi:hypothetical protein